MGMWRVAALGGGFGAVAVAVSVFGDRIPVDIIMMLVGLLAVVGVFCLFALAAGLFRFAQWRERRTLVPRGGR